MFNLLEELLLFTVHEEKGTIPLAASMKIDFCLAGALLMELELLQRIRVSKKTLEVVDRTSTGNSRLDTLLKLIDNSKRIQTPHYWISKIKGTFKHLRRESLEQLVDRGYLREEERPVFWLFTSTAYPLRDDRPKREIRDHLRLIILRGETSTPKRTKLLTLMYACGLTDTLFDKEERKAARKKVKEFAKEDLLAQALIKTIEGANSGSYTGSF